MKKTFLFLFAATLIFVSAIVGTEYINLPQTAITAEAATPYISGNWTYTVSSNVATITGYTGTETNITFPTTLGEYKVKNVGYSALKNNTAIISVTIPEGYVSIGDSAFYGCSNLKNVSIPKTIQNIGTGSYSGSSFENCIRLETVTLAEGGTVTATIHTATFKGCTALKSITIPANYKNTGSQAFLGCTSLKTVIIKENSDQYFERTVDYRSFDGCTALTEIDIPEGFVSIGDQAFFGCSNLGKARIPKTIQNIGTGSYSGSSFENCIRLETVTLAEGGTVTATIHTATFKGCTALKSITIPSNYKNTGSQAFLGCTSLKTVIIKENVDQYFERTVDYRSFDGCTALTTVHIPEKLESISDDAFNNCSSDLVICSISSDCVAKTYADENDIPFVLCNGEHEIPDIITTYTITYDANGGSGAPAAQTGATEYVISSTVPVRDGYKFLGWAFDKDATSASCTGGANIAVTADTVLYAVWEKISDEPTTQPITKPTDPTTEPTQPTTKPTEPVTQPTEPTTKPTEPVTEPSTKKPAVSVIEVSIKMKTPSQSTINYGDSIILHAEVKNLPEGAEIVWSANNGNFKIVSTSVDGMTCTVTPQESGDTLFTVTVVDENGNELGSDEQRMSSKAGIWQKIVAFFKKLFGLTKIIPEAFKNIF